MRSPADSLPALMDLPSCRLGMQANELGQITSILFLHPETPLKNRQTPLEQSLCAAVTHWLDGTPVPALPFAPCGTRFQQDVWQLIREIPRGRTAYYGELAARLDSSARAVGQACGDNPFPLFTPCHRVLGKHGNGGFAHAESGWLMQTKLWLLQHEGA